MPLGALCVAVIAVLVATAYTRQSEPASRCYRASDFALPHVAFALRGDVDGDGRVDVVTSRTRWLDSRHCRLTLVVRTRAGVVRTALATSSSAITPLPLTVLVRLPKRAGLVIASQPWEGASTGFAKLFGIERARLLPLAPAQFLFAGSDAHRHGVDCTRRRGAVLVAAAARHEGRRYLVERRFYALRAGRLRRRPALDERYRVPQDALDRFPEIAEVPFPHCGGVRP